MSSLRSRLKLESHAVGSILPDVVDLPLDYELRDLSLREQSDMEKVTLEVSEDLQ